MPFTTAPLTPADISQLQAILHDRRRAVWKRLKLTVLLPLPVVLLVMWGINAYILYRMQVEEMDIHTRIPQGIEDYVLLWVAVPIMAVPIFANIVMFVRSIPPVHIDIKRGRKNMLPFMPKPYSLPGSGRYYVEVGYPALRFLEVTYEQYHRMDYSTPCYLMMAPLSAIPLGIKTGDNLIAHG